MFYYGKKKQVHPSCHVKEIVRLFRVPLELCSNQGRNFDSSVFQEMCKILEIRTARTTVLHSQSGEMVESMDRTVGKYQKLSLIIIICFLCPANVLFSQELHLQCDLKICIKPNEEVFGEDYVSSLRKRMDEIHNRVRTHIYETSNQMELLYDI